MAMIIGHASIDENGKIQGGKVGDQNGKEVCTRSYYMHSKGWYLLRPKDVAHAIAIAEAMLRACNNAYIGYDQGNRLGVIKYGTRTKTKTECDCSSLVRQCVIEATGKDPGNFTTSNEVSKLEATGLFEKAIAVTSSTVLYDGDILVTKTKGHTVIIVSGNPRKPKATTPATTRNYLIKGDKGAEVKTMQENLIYLGYSCGKSGADGDFGGDTEKAVMAFQKDKGLEQDGKYGTLSKAALEKSVAQKKSQANKGNPIVRAGQQHAVNFTGVKIGIDGIAGAETKQMKARVLQHALNLDYGETITEDGDFKTKSKKKLGSHYVKKGEEQYMVTAAEILMMLNGIDPKGVECPGSYGNGLMNAAKQFFGDDGMKITASEFLKLIA